jgi:hypothetical protein
VQNLNQAAIQNQLNAYQARLQSYIDSTPSGATSTVGEVIGKQVIPQQTRSLLESAAFHFPPLLEKR